MNRKSERTLIKESKGDRITSFICLVTCILFLVIFIVPVGYVIYSSLHSQSGWSLDGYIILLKNPLVLSGLKNSLIISTVGTVLSLSIEIVTAYVLANPRLKMKNKFISFLLFSSYLGTGIIPLFLLLKSFSMIDTIWAVILPGCFSVYYTLHLRTRFINMGQEMYEAAAIDGCQHIGYLFRIALPIIAPTVSTTAFFHFCSYWGSFIYARTFLVSEEKYPLALVLNEILIKNRASDVLSTSSNAQSIDAITMAEFALCVISALPVVCFYLFLKRKVNSVDEGDGLVL